MKKIVTFRTGDKVPNNAKHLSTRTVDEEYEYDGKSGYHRNIIVHYFLVELQNHKKGEE